MFEGQYEDPIPDFGEIMSVTEFFDCVSCGVFTDYDGVGNPIRGDRMDHNQPIYPSTLDEIPNDAEKIIWFNK